MQVNSFGFSAISHVSSKQQTQQRKPYASNFDSYDSVHFSGSIYKQPKSRRDEYLRQCKEFRIPQAKLKEIRARVESEVDSSAGGRARYSREAKYLKELLKEVRENINGEYDAPYDSAYDE